MARLVAWIKDNPVPAGLGGAALVGLGAYLVFGVFGFHLIFVDEVVDEANPFAADSAPSGIAGDDLTEETADAMNDAMAEDDVPMEVEASEPKPPDMPAEPQIISVGDFVDRSHPTSGIAEVLTDGTRRVLRFEDFETDNGPDLNVYLVAAAPDAPVGELAADFVDLGDLKGNIGAQNYDIPDDVDLDRYTTVVVWCVRFGVAFGAAPLA